MIRKIVNILRYVFVRHRKYQFARQGKKVIIGNGCIINSASMIEFGDNVSIGPNAVLYAIYKKIIFGNNVMLGPHVTIVNGDHNIRKIGVAIIDNHEKYWAWLCCCSRGGCYIFFSCLLCGRRSSCTYFGYSFQFKASYCT